MVLAIFIVFYVINAVVHYKITSEWFNEHFSMGKAHEITFFIMMSVIWPVSYIGFYLAKKDYETSRSSTDT